MPLNASLGSSSSANVDTTKVDPPLSSPKIHVFPCQLNYTGATAGKLFTESVFPAPSAKKPSASSGEDDRSKIEPADMLGATFRGRPLVGKAICLPSNCKAMVTRRLAGEQLRESSSHRGMQNRSRWLHVASDAVSSDVTQAVLTTEKTTKPELNLWMLESGSGVEESVISEFETVIKNYFAVEQALHGL